MYIGYPLVISDYVADKIITKHKISVSEVEDSIRQSICYARKGRGEELYEILTHSSLGNYLFIVIKNIKGIQYKLITARPMSKDERKYYEKKRP